MRIGNQQINRDTCSYRNNNAVNKNSDKYNSKNHITNRACSYCGGKQSFGIAVRHMDKCPTTVLEKNHFASVCFEGQYG